MKLCTECRHFRPNKIVILDSQRIEYAKCGHPDKLSPLDGSPTEYCQTQRDYDMKGTCGPDGRHWEDGSPPAAKRPWWKFWVSLSAMAGNAAICALGLWAIWLLVR